MDERRVQWVLASDMPRSKHDGERGENMNTWETIVRLVIRIDELNKLDEHTVSMQLGPRHYCLKKEIHQEA